VNRRLALYAAFAAAAFISLWLWWQDGHAVALTDAPAGKLDCVSYTPSRNQPLLPTQAVTRLKLEHDLTILAARFRCVRIYSVGSGLDQVPTVARQLGLKVLLGLWIGSDPELNQREIKRGLQVAERDKDVIEAVIVGNEVLLRRELTVEQLARLIRQVNSNTTIPVTYADVWDFWKVNPQLEADTDFITIHLLPYWDDKPTGIDAALAHTANVYAEARATFPNKRVFIGETGWPSQGRQRVDAAPGAVAQARFVREFTSWAQQHDIQYNLIEAFDQPWKRAQEGTVGGYWGMYDAHGDPKFPLQGAMAEDAGWRVGLWGAGAGAVILLGLGLLLAGSRGRPDALLLLLAGAAAGAIALMQWRYLSTTNRNLTEWVASAIIVLVGGVLYGWIVLSFSGRKSLERLPAPESIFETLDSLDHREFRARPAAHGRIRTLGVLRFVLLLGFAYVCLGLAVDARYRGFPTCLYVLPVMALSLLSLFDRGGRALQFRLMPEETALAMLAGGCSVVIALREGWHNPSALGLAGLGLTFACSLLIPAGRRARNHE
jgi:glucan 1,3-beta-glucosidase